MKSLIGREKEISILENYYHSSKSEMIAVYGRRRVGKTFLIKETLEDRLDFEFIGMYKTSAKIQREQFQKTINALSGNNDKTPSDWFGAFDNLKAYLLSLNEEIVTVFLDELPWMDSMNSNFLSAFSMFWNSWNSKKKLLKLYVCGSSTTWMVDKLIGDQGGLYGRISRPIYLAPFSLYETEKYLNTLKKMNYNRMQILEVYMIFGGIPYYLDMLDRSLPLSSNVDALFFDEDAPLRTEYDFLFRSLFKQSTNYQKVVELLSTRLSGLTRDEISSGCGLNGGEFTQILKNLNSCDFIRVYSYPGKKEKGKMFQLYDMFTLFYLRFVRGYNGQDRHYWTNSNGSGTRNAWSGYAFEQVCLHHITQIKNKLGISGILSNVYAWNEKAFTDSDGNHWDGGQIDLIIDRNDNVMNLCEMKYSHDEYIINGTYNRQLRERISLFKVRTKTKKALRCTLVTTQGVKPNKYSDIADDQIVLNDMFSKQ
ncbi:MAG: ATP-binding protein [Eubacterium sp.]|nr:ATP-binding protein [Eubacterium sp.]